MTAIKRIFCFFNVLVLCVFIALPSFAQNLITNGDFESGNTGFSTDYIYYPTGGMPAGRYCIDNTVSGHGQGSLGGFLPPNGSTGKYMIVNGYGGNNNQNKVVWKQTVNVTSNTWYRFSFKYTNLSRYYYFYGEGAILRFLINGVRPSGVSDIQLNAGDDDWHTYPDFRWNSGDLTGPVEIEFRDVYSGSDGDGDDFALDNISFIPEVVYGVDAQDDYVQNPLCLNDYVDVDVLQNDNVLPNTNDAQVQILTNPIPHGTAVVLSNKKIRYTFNDANYYGEVQFEYRVNNHGVQSQATVHINTALPPTVGSISNIVPDAACAPYTLPTNTPDIQWNGSTQIGQGWQMQIGGQWVNAPGSIEYQHNGCSLRYYAQNGCETSYSNTVSLTVNDEPLVGSVVIPPGVCEGDALELTTPTGLEWRHNDPSTCWGSWEIQINGVWDSLVNNNIPFEYNGCQIRYKAVNGCGVSYSTNYPQITVYSTEAIDEGVITACEALVHHGITCNQSGEVYTWDSLSPNNCIIPVHWLFVMGDVNIMPVETIERCDSYYWPRTGITYYESTIAYDTVYSTDPQVCDSIFTLDLTINHAPTIQGNIQAQDICAGNLLTIAEPQYEYNHSGGGSHQWEFATLPEGPFQPFAPDTYHFEYGSYYIRFAVINGCDSVFSDTLLVNVNDQPVINGQLSPLQVCEGNPLDLPEVTVDWYNASQSGFSEWQMAETMDGNYSHFESNSPMQMGQDGYYVRYIARNECDTVYLGPVRITVIPEQEEWLDHSDCDTVWFNGIAYTEDQVVVEDFNDPCPHTIHHRIIVKHSDRPETNPTMIEEITSCHDEFEWHGHTYYRTDGPQTDRWYTVNASGCDSIRELRLDFGDYATKTESYLKCDEFVWTRNNMTYYYDESNPQILDSVSIPGNEIVCDSVIYLNLIMGGSYEREGEPLTECRGFEWHGMSYYEDAIVYDSLKTKVTNCDSIISYQLTIIQPFDTVVEMVSCQPTWWHGHHFVEDEIYTDTLESTVTGCDSIVTVHFVLSDDIPPYEFDTVSCSPFIWHEYECIYDGMTCYHTFQTPAGCDSTVIMHVHLQNGQNNVQFLTRCDSITLYGVLYELPEGETSHSYRIVTDTLVGANGCDSIMITNLTLRDSQSIGQISGSSQVIVASSLFSGIYQYIVDTTDIEGRVSWSLSNPEWQILDHDGVSCRIFVTTPGSATLTARFNIFCGEVERVFEINAGFFGVDDNDYITAHVYPNPTTGLLTVEAEGIESIRLTNMMGQVLDWREYSRSNVIVLNLNGFVPSVYLLEINTINGMVKRKVALSR